MLIANPTESLVSAETMGDENEFIIGFDTLPSHSPKSKTSPKFACVIMKGGTILNEYPEISRSNLLRIIREIRPKWISTDNIFEVVSDSKSLFRFVNRIPPETQMVQVTGVPPHQMSLKRLAKCHGLSARGKIAPLDAARIVAQLTFLGVGHRLECFGEQTEIKITRGRKPGRGGQSANRFRRKVHSVIQQMTRFIESQVKEAGIDYDIDIRESDFGYSSACIIAFAPLPVIRDLIESKRGGDFKVLISPVRKRAEFLPLEPKPTAAQIRPKYFILGIDPGSTAAICLLPLSGHNPFLLSAKSLTRADIIREVYERGIPVMVATDVNTVPNFVKKIASILNTELFVPKKEISVADKQEIAREFSDSGRIRNAHERDALTAAVYAYRSLLPKLEQIDRKVRDKQLVIDRNQLKALVIKGMPMAEAISILLHKESEEVEVEPEPPQVEEPLTQEKYDLLKSKYEEVESENEILHEKLEDHLRVVEYLKFRESELAHSLEIINKKNYWRIKRDRELAKKESELKQMRRETDGLHKRIKMLEDRLKLIKGVKHLEMRGDMLAIKLIPHFTKESIQEYNKKVGIRFGDIVLFEDASGGGSQTAGLLIEQGVRAVITDSPLSHLSEDALVKAAVPVISADKVELQRIDEFAFISKKKFEQQFHRFILKVKEQARQKGEEELIELVERYRREIER
ncbi:MAG: DUF460 domain-containing protein [Candidatus Thorarchaeota archaeon]|nr:DUF460 domain-containing protein [Candidatus Thorarchaeota archaeon]